MRRRKFIASMSAVGVGLTAGCTSADSGDDKANRDMSRFLEPNKGVFQAIEYRDGTLVVRLEDPPLIAKEANPSKRVADAMYADEVNIIDATTGRVAAEDDIDLSATEYAFSVPEGAYRVSLEVDKTDAHHSNGGYVHLYAQVTVEGEAATIKGYELEAYTK